MEETPPDRAPKASVHIPTSSMSEIDSDNQDQLHLTELAPQNSLSGTADTFTLFPKLPIELLLKIWKETLPEARVPMVANYRQQAAENHHPPIDRPAIGHSKDRLRTRDLVEACPDSIALKVCHESLEVA